MFELTYTNRFSFTDSVDRIVALPGANDTKLLVFYSNGAAAAVFDFDGQHAPAAVQQFNAEAGEHFTGAGVLGQNGFLAYSAALGQNASTKFTQWNWNGSSYSNAASGSLPMLNLYSAAGNVLQFQFEPFVTNNPLLLRLNNAGQGRNVPQRDPGPGQPDSDGAWPGASAGDVRSGESVQQHDLALQFHAARRR